MSGTKTEVIALLRSEGLVPKRSLGQNFLIEATLARRIARLAEVGPGGWVVEVGAGLGALTRALAETGARVVAIEIDSNLIPLLERSVAGMNVQVVAADASKLDWGGLLEGPGPWSLVANLPYNMATSLIVTVLDSVPAVQRLVVMVQAEVAERLVAGPGSRTYGAVSVQVAYWASAKLLQKVPPEVFTPRPRVESALVRLVRREPPDFPYEELVRLVKAGFGQRRKMLRSSLRELVDADTLVACGVRPESRAEELDLAAWGRLAAWLSSNRPASG